MREASGVPRKERCPPDITEFQDEHHDPFEPDPPTPMGRTSPSKAADVVGHSHRVYAVFIQTLF